VESKFNDCYDIYTLHFTRILVRFLWLVVAAALKFTLFAFGPWLPLLLDFNFRFCNNNIVQDSYLPVFALTITEHNSLFYILVSSKFPACLWSGTVHYLPTYSGLADLQPPTANLTVKSSSLCSASLSTPWFTRSSRIIAWTATGDHQLPKVQGRTFAEPSSLDSIHNGRFSSCRRPLLWGHHLK
jgi:hypothetical protein